MKFVKPVLQVALDFIDLNRALKLAEEAVDGGCDWIEAGTPLIKSAGLDCLRELRKKFPHKKLIADMKIMDTGRIEVEIAAKAGANIVTVLGCAGIKTIKECILAGKNYGAEIMVDLMETDDFLETAKYACNLGANYICVHTSIDEQMIGKISFEKVKKLSKTVNIPVAVAGGLNSENVADAIKSGAEIIIVGGAITKSDNVNEAVKNIRKAMEKKVTIHTKYYKRVDFKNVRETLLKVSSANISDAMHRGKVISGFISIVDGVKMVSKVTTVRTYPGDWAKPVEAIDVAECGDIIVIDAGGVGPAVWGELATHSAIQKKLSGVIINGGIRDVEEIKKLKFPAYAKVITGQAGEPKGFGEINVPVVIDGVRIIPGDWIFSDNDGIVVIPKDEVVEITNRAMDVLERENRIRSEIQKGKTTLGKVTELLKWEKK